MQKERIEIFNNVNEGKIPKRVPINVFFSLEVIAQRYNLNLLDVQWNPALLEESVDKFCNEFYSDISPYRGAIRWPAYYQLIGSKSFVMSSTGYMQHPESSAMLPEDYDEFIKNPFNCIVETLIPRQYTKLNPSEPMRAAMNLCKAAMAYGDDFMAAGMTAMRMNEKYGYYSGEPGVDGGTTAPYDFIADELRGFKGISMDIRRCPEKVLEALDAIYPMIFETGMPKIISRHGRSGMMLHMPTFMKRKDFEKFYWPSLTRLVNEYASLGVSSYLFCEDDWTRYLDDLQELPTDTLIYFEYGDPKLFKDKLGDKHILMGNYPLVYLRNNTKQACIDKAKELIDVLAPGGKYIFNFDKGAMTINDFDLENCNAVTEFVRDYAVYDSNVGEKTGLQFNKDDYKATPHEKFSTKYLQSVEDQKIGYDNVTDYAAQKLYGYEERVFRFLKGLIS